ncbi:MAG: hypothetical protein HYZ34_13205 [Ignavibacteriae bacterium]|nr:hypothetical protein [Ignavibacteriota bacterium]
MKLPCIKKFCFSGIGLLYVTYLFMESTLSAAPMQKEAEHQPSFTVPSKNYTVREGLLSNAITKIYQDSRGFLWIGTLEGLCIFDGVSFRHYTTLEGLASVSVNDLLESRTNPGTMWIATNGGGVNKLSNETVTTFSMGYGAWSNRVNKVLEDHRGRVWCLSDSGVFLIENDVVKPFSLLPSVIDNFHVIELGDSAIWIANKNGVFSYNENSGQVTTTGISATIGTWAFVLARNEDFWISTSDSGFLQYRQGSLLKRHPVHIPGYVMMLEDRHGYFWAGSTTGLYKLSKEHDSLRVIAHYTTRNGLPEDIIQNGLIDRENCLWLGTSRQGFSRLMDGITEMSFPLLDLKTNLKAVKDNNDHLWMGSSDGLLEIWRDDDKQPQSYVHRLGRKKDIHSVLLLLDSLGHLWAMVDTQEIHEYSIIALRGQPSQLKKLKSLEKGKELPAGTIYPFMVDRTCRLWYNTDKGIEALDPNRNVPRIRTITQSEGLPDYSIWSLLEDSKGGYWFGGYIGDLSRFTFEPGEEFQIKSVHRYSEFPDKSVRLLFEDSKGRIWVGTRYGGIAIFDGEQTMTLSRKNGLPGEWIYMSSISKCNTFGVNYGNYSYRCLYVSQTYAGNYLRLSLLLGGGLSAPAQPGLFSKYWKRGFNLSGGIEVAPLPNIAVNIIAEQSKFPYNTDVVPGYSDILSGGEATFLTISANLKWYPLSHQTR